MLNETLPLYKAIKDLRSYVYDVIVKLPNYLKHPLGKMMCEEMFLAVRYLAASLAPEISREDRVNSINSLLFEMDVLLDQISFLVEKRAISLKQSAVMVEKVSKIQKQLGGLRKHLRGVS